MIKMWIFKRRKEQKLEKKQEIKVKFGETFVLGPGESASTEIPIPVEIIKGQMKLPGNKLGKILARYEDTYGNKYEVEAEIDIKDIKDNREKRLKSKTRIIYYGPFEKRIPSIAKSILIIGIIGIVAYFVTDSFNPIIYGLGVYVILEIIMEINYNRVNKKYNDNRNSITEN